MHSVVDRAMDWPASAATEPVQVSLGVTRNQ
jgi:hypothetical protein